MKSYMVFAISLLLSSMSVAHVGAFDKAAANAVTTHSALNDAAANLQHAQESTKKALNNFNGPNRFNTPGDPSSEWNTHVEDKVTSTQQAVQRATAAYNKASIQDAMATSAVNGTSYRDQITKQQKAAMVGIPTPVDNVPSTVTNIPGKVVSIPFVAVRGGYNEHTNNAHNDHGTGNGSNNAANSNSAHGLGGGDHIGGGCSGGGYHY